MDLQGNTLLSENCNTINNTEVELRKAKLKDEISQCLRKLDFEEQQSSPAKEVEVKKKK